MHLGSPGVLSWLLWGGMGGCWAEAGLRTLGKICFSLYPCVLTSSSFPWCLCGVRTWLSHWLVFRFGRAGLHGRSAFSSCCAQACGVWRAQSGLRSSASYISGKIKTSQDGHDECVEKKLIVQYILSPKSFYWGGKKVTWFGLQDKNTPEFTKTNTWVCISWMCDLARKICSFADYECRFMGMEVIISLE